MKTENKLYASFHQVLIIFQSFPGVLLHPINRKAAIVYPPITETASLESNDWTYWAHRFNRFIVHFKNDKVENIVN